jgi:predicted MFS family arabinose efflux permease
MKSNSRFLWALALAVFAIITTELGIIGLLLQLVSQRGISAKEVGLLVSAYAMVVAVTGPFMTLLMSRWDKKKVLLGVMLLFVLSNIVFAYSDSYATMMWFRVLPALVHAPFFAVTLVAATHSVAPEERPKAAGKVFAGVAVGLVLGVPLSSFIAEQLSLHFAFLFGAVVSALAFVAIFLLMPSAPTARKISFGKQLGILRHGPLWLTISTVVFVFAAMFSSYSYITEYLRDVTHMSRNWISIMLMAFGIFGVSGNFFFSALLQKNVTRTVIAYPLLYLGVFLLAYGFGSSLPLMLGLTVLWGLLHSAGLIVSQTWLMREAQDAPEFANSLYISFSNLGITIGAALAGWFITLVGTQHLMWVSILFAALAWLSILIKIRMDRPRRLTTLLQSESQA